MPVQLERGSALLEWWADHFSTGISFESLVLQIVIGDILTGPHVSALKFFECRDSFDVVSGPLYIMWVGFIVVTMLDFCLCSMSDSRRYYHEQSSLQQKSLWKTSVFKLVHIS